ncbi:MAG: hypothetical protein AAFN93_22465, partial [Bacteroidota bacterium]
DKDERIFIATDSIAKDTSAPVISGYQIKKIDGIIVNARIHDYKSPNRPSDWQTIELKYEVDGNALAQEMVWYGEYLWKAKITDADIDQNSLSLCAVDKAGNRTCIELAIN